MMPFERLVAWERCHALTILVYRITRAWPKDERYGLVSQARRAATSEATNIAGGAAKRGIAEFRRFLDMALGSPSELAHLLRLARDLQSGEPRDLTAVEALQEEASKTTWGSYASMSRKREGLPRGGSPR